MKLLSKFFVSRKSHDRLADELHRTSLALERSRAESVDLKRRLEQVEVEALELERSNQHLLGLLRKAQAERQHKQKGRRPLRGQGGRSESPR